MNLAKRRVWYVADDRALLSGRLLSGGKDTPKASLLVGMRGRGGEMLRQIDAPYSEGRQPGTWHFQSAPS